LEDLLIALNPQDTVLKSALPLVLDSLNLVVGTEHNLICILTILLVCGQVLGVVQIGIDGILIIIHVIIVTCRIALGSADALDMSGELRRDKGLEIASSDSAWNCAFIEGCQKSATSE